MEAPSADFIKWIGGLFVTAIVMLAGAVTALWKRSESKNAKQIEALTIRVDECEDDRSDLRERVARLETRLQIEYGDEV